MFIRLPVLIIALLLTVSLYGQEKIRRTSTNLDTYVGTWEYATKTDTFQIVFTKGQRVMDHFTSDCLFGVHYYKKDGKVIVDYRYLLPHVDDDNQTIYATNAVSPQYKDNFKPNQLSFSFYDNENNKVVRGWFTRDPNKPNEAKWHFNKDEWHERWISEDTPEEDRPKPGYSVPDEVIMKKIK